MSAFRKLIAANRKKPRLHGQGLVESRCLRGGALRRRSSLEVD
jgi:hypothetical protein